MKLLESAFNDIEELYGKGSLERVRQMIADNTSRRMAGQEEAKWVLPGLSTEPWLNKNSFDLKFESAIVELEGNSQDIIAEFNQVKHNILIRPYEHYLGKYDNWNGIYLFKDGEWMPESDSHFRRSKNILSECLGGQLCPLLEVHFSILDPKSSIPLHCDLWNFTLNLHLGINIPPDCYISVNGETRGWEAGKTLLFDYSFQHEAWNDSSLPRTCLLMDIWHPELSVPEKYALTYFVKYLREQTTLTTESH
ncbi:MAG: aspartyl/asparaginyl beta-hydroxylase domain-containing protein [Alteromonadaceae bacterium]|nr:aspartyl/asparaginyl beta-hydroxylase domain-containing protein [Alteromonadaceae bacterium]